MKIFLCVFLASLALVASQGYNYQQQQLPQQHQQQQLPQQQQQLSQQQQLPPILQQYAPQPQQQFQPQYQQQNQFVPQAQPFVMQITPSVQVPLNSYIPPPIYSPPVSSGPISSGPISSGPVSSGPISAPAFVPQPRIRNQQAYRPRPSMRVKKPIVSKSFFIHSAPEETEDEVQEELAQLAQQPRKHYNVLFIKSPTQTNRATALNFAQSLNEEKTVVYVLTKKTTAADLQDAARDAPQKTSKPEVFFIKYRTPEEAANAQREIQAQYDTLGGSSTISDEGTAQVTSVIGSLEPQIQEEDAAQSENYEEVVDNSLSNNNGYLPPQY